MKNLLPLLLLLSKTVALSSDSEEKDGDSSRRILGSSVVTSVSVIRDTGNGTQIIDAVGKPVPKPHGASPVASPINLLNPDRYEFFTFNDNGELVKRLMTLEEIQGIIANGDGEDVNYNVAEYLPEKKVNDIVSNVQNVLKEQMINHKPSPNSKPILDTPDVSNTWSMILPAFFGNTGDEIAPDKPQNEVTPDTLVVTDDISTKLKEFEKLTTPLYKGDSSSTKIVETLTTLPSTSSTMELLKTTSVPETSPNISSKISSVSTTEYPKLSTEQYVGDVKKSTTEKPIESKSEPTTQTPFVTVAIISDTKYNTTNLEESSNSPIVSILSMEDIFDDKPTTVEIKLNEPDVRTTPTLNLKVKYSTKPAEITESTTPISTTSYVEGTSKIASIPTTKIASTTNQILITDKIPVTTQTSTKTSEELKTAETNQFSNLKTETSTKSGINDPGTTSTKIMMTSVQMSKLPDITTKLPLTTKFSSTTKLPLTTKNPTQPSTRSPSPLGSTTQTSTNEVTESDSNDQPTEVTILTTQTSFPSSTTENNQPTEVKILTTQGGFPSSTTQRSFTTSTLQGDLQSSTQGDFTPEESFSSSASQGIFSALTTRGTFAPSTTQKLNIQASKLPENVGFSTWSSFKGEVPATSTTPLTILKDEEIPQKPSKLEESSPISNVSTFKTTTPIWIIIKRKPEIVDQKLGNEQLKINGQNQNVQSFGEQHLQSSNEQQKIYGLSEQQKIHNLNEQQKIHNLNEQQKIHNLNEQQKIHNLNEQQKIHNLNEQLKIHNLNEQQKIHNLNEQQKIHNLNEQQKIQNLNEQLKIHNLNEQQKIHNLNEQQKIHNLNEQQKIHNLNEQQKIHSSNEQQKIQSTNELQKVQNLNEEQKVHNLTEQQSLQSLNDQDNSFEQTIQYLENFESLKNKTSITQESVRPNNLQGGNSTDPKTPESPNLKVSTNQNVQNHNDLKTVESSSSLQKGNVQNQGNDKKEDNIQGGNVQIVNNVLKVSSTQKIEIITEEIPTTLPIELKNMPIITHSPLTTTKIYEINAQLSQKLPGKSPEIYLEKLPSIQMEKLPEMYPVKLPEIHPEKLFENTSEKLPEVNSAKYSEKHQENNPENLTESSLENQSDYLSDKLTTNPNISDIEITSPEMTTESLEGTTYYTTQPSLIESIHQLLFQTVNDVEDPIVNVDANEKIEEILMTMKDRPMQDLQDEAATIGSSLETKNQDNIKSDVSDVTEVPTTVSVEESEFSEAISSVMSQIYGLDGATTIEDFTSTRTGDESSTIPMDKVNFETTTFKIVEEETETPNTDNSSTQNNELKKNVTNDEELPETSPIPYGEKLTTRQVVTSTPKTIDDLPEKNNHSWTLVSTISPPNSPSTQPFKPSQTTPPPIKLPSQPFHGFGLEETTSRLDTDVYQFVELCNELSFGFWTAVTNGISSARSIFVSPFAATSLLAMVFLGARGATSGEMNEILKLDDMVTFNPHLIFKNVSESIEAGKGTGVAVSVIARELYSDRSKGKLLNFYKERAKQFYDGFVEEVNFKEIGDVVRRRTNLIVKKSSGGKIQEYLKDSSITLRPPLAGVSASVFETDCSSASTEGRDGELHFVVLPSIRQRKLVPIPAAVYRSGFLAGYDPQLDATAAAIGGPDQVISTIFVIPGQQGIAAPGDGLLRLERQLADTAFKKGSWGRLLRSLIPRPGLELQIPRFMHKSIINSTVALQRMGLKDLFSFDKADLRGLNGQAHELHLSDVLQLNTFATCGENIIREDHHTEIYPATSRRPSRRSRKLGFYLPESVFAMERGEYDEPRDYQRSFDDPLHDPDLLTLPLPLRPRQARLPDAPRLRFDRPFLFFIRHNPTGLILHMGRFNPRLLP